MFLENQMTNEVIKKHYHNNFDLTNFAIDIARQHMGKEEELPSLMQLLTEVLDIAEDKEEQEVLEA